MSPSPAKRRHGIVTTEMEHRMYKGTGSTSTLHYGETACLYTCLHVWKNASDGRHEKVTTSRRCQIRDHQSHQIRRNRIKNPTLRGTHVYELALVCEHCLGWRHEKRRNPPTPKSEISWKPTHFLFDMSPNFLIILTSCLNHLGTGARMAIAIERTPSFPRNSNDVATTSVRVAKAIPYEGGIFLSMLQSGLGRGRRPLQLSYAFKCG